MQSKHFMCLQFTNADGIVGGFGHRALIDVQQNMQWVRCA